MAAFCDSSGGVEVELLELGVLPGAGPEHLGCEVGLQLNSDRLEVLASGHNVELKTDVVDQLALLQLVNSLLIVDFFIRILLNLLKQGFFGVFNLLGYSDYIFFVVGVQLHPLLHHGLGEADLGEFWLKQAFERGFVDALLVVEAGGVLVLRRAFQGVGGAFLREL